MTLTVVEFFIASWLLTALLMVRAWFIQRRHENAAVVDLVWCVAFALLVIVAARTTDGDVFRRITLAVMGAIWGLRLASHVLVDRMMVAREDSRYRTLRKRWGNRAQPNFFLLFQGEALVIPVFLLPLFVLMQNPRPTFSVWEWCGITLYVIAISGEWLADRQLAQFRRNPANEGKTCREGLWRYSRHPNYFFESLHWWAYVPMGIGVSYGWLTLIGAITMTFSLLFITGIPLAEAQAVVARGEEYREYQRTTSAFIPWFPSEKKQGQ
jgi:steroid 5-alpha reductase family enzyme